MSVAAGEPLGTIVVTGDRLGALDIAPGEVPGLIDELPAISALAAHGGQVTVHGAGELRVKESDRITTLAVTDKRYPRRRQAMLDIASGEAGIVIGTHALLEEKVQFFDLGLVVVDEVQLPVGRVRVRRSGSAGGHSACIGVCH